LADEAELTRSLKPRLKSFYETIRLPKLDGKFIDAVLSKKQRFFPFSTPNIDTACDVVVVPHHVGSVLFHRKPPVVWLDAMGNSSTGGMERPFNS
jgi:hypothetical protein